MAYQKDYKFVFDDGEIATLQAKGKGQAAIMLSAVCQERVGEIASGTDEDGKTFKAKVVRIR